MILLRWTFGAPNANAAMSPGWVWPPQVRSARVFVPRVRTWRLVMGHARSDDPYADTGEG